MRVVEELSLVFGLRAISIPTHRVTMHMKRLTTEAPISEEILPDPSNPQLSSIMIGRSKEQLHKVKKFLRSIHPY